MPVDPIATRYAQALFETAKAEGSVDETLAQLTLIGQLLHDSAGLRQLLWNPNVDPQDKVGVFDRILQQSWSALVRAFIQMVVSQGRSESLSAMVEAFAATVDADQGRLRVTVRCAHPLPDAILSRLRTQLSHREQKQIDLQTEVAPELLGGFQLFLGNRVIDGSVRRQLDDLRDRLHAVRVY